MLIIYVFEKWKMKVDRMNVLRIFIVILFLLIYGVFIYCEKKADKESSPKAILIAAIFCICGVGLMQFIYPKVNELLFLHDMDVNETKEVKYSNNDASDEEETTNNSIGETVDISNDESGSKKLCDLKVESANDRFTQIETESEIDTFGNRYAAKNLFQLNTYGESIWGEYGYSEDRRAFGKYDIAYKYESVSGTIAVSDKTSNEKVCARLEILGDSKILEYYDLQRNTEPIEFEINDITNVDELEFNLVFRSDDGAGDVYVLLSDVILKENPIVGQPSENDNVQKLSSMKIINYNENFEKISTHSMTDIFGNVYWPDNVFELETYGESIWGDYGYSEDRIAYGEFYINQQYQELNGIISVSDNTEDEQVGGIFAIYDETHQEIYHQELNRNSEPVQIEGLNVSDKKWIRFELQFHVEEGAGDFRLLMSDFEFIK